MTVLGDAQHQMLPVPERACCEAKIGNLTLSSNTLYVFRRSVVTTAHVKQSTRLHQVSVQRVPLHNPRPTSCEQNRLSDGEKSSILRKALEF